MLLKKKHIYLVFTLYFLNIQLELHAGSNPELFNKKTEITLTVLTMICDHLKDRPIALKVYIDGGTPEYSLYAGGLVTGKITEHEFVILGLHGGEGTNVTVTDALGESAEFYAKAIIMPSPGADAGPEKFISCSDSSAVLNGTSDIENVHYSWSGPDPLFDVNAQNPEVKFPGIYHLKVSSMVNGCQSYDSTLVHLPEQPVFEYDYDPLVCFGDSSGVIRFESITNGIEPYEYSVDGGERYQNQPVFEHLNADTFELVVKDHLGCLAESSIVELVEPDSLILDLGEDLFMHYGEHILLPVETNLDQEDISSIQWSPKEGLSCYDCLDPSASPENSITYQLEIIDKMGCFISDTLFIEVEKKIDVFIPNAFSPNGDGWNDVFYIKGASGVTAIISLEIFNRWGNKVFGIENVPPNEPDFGWDGKYQGHFLAPGVFVYKAVIELYNAKEIVLFGDLSLLH